jgi:uncharacterized protein DUF3152
MRNPPPLSAGPLPRREFVLEPHGPEPAPARRRFRLLTAVAYLLLAAAVIFLGRLARFDGEKPDRIVVPAPPTAAETSGPPEPRPIHPAVREVGTSGQFAVVPGYGPVLGAAGPVHRFRVAIEKPTGPGSADFANEVNRTLGDRRSWIAPGRFRWQRVPAAAHAEFTIYLASARTSQRMCRAGGLETGAYTSCRLPRQVIINDDRWTGAVSGYGAPLATYRAYVINHEVGHQLGHGHEKCPGKGRPAPVMMQQTYGLKGCVANSWPYRKG